ncbi:hypothetical protein [Bacillus toyonensis]|uniref:hypothetical protein n=1 Tax=Bacillus toyonensis TaxID=155322 RepID=UPI002E1A7AEA|nr:hypothetical protein [Bacillus toyonensis]
MSHLKNALNIEELESISYQADSFTAEQETFLSNEGFEYDPYIGWLFKVSKDIYTIRVYATPDDFDFYVEIGDTNDYLLRTGLKYNNVDFHSAYLALLEKIKDFNKLAEATNQQLSKFDKLKIFFSSYHRRKTLNLQGNHGYIPDVYGD